MSLGEIIFMEGEAHERDQIQWACSAQNDKMLPKRKKKKGSIKQQIQQRVSPVFEAYYREHGHPTKGK